MVSAWDQAGDLRRANSMLRHAQLVRRAFTSIHTNHISKLASSQLLDVSRPVHTQITLAASTTVRKMFIDKSIPLSVVSREFRMVSRPRGPLMRAVFPPGQRIIARWRGGWPRGICW